MSFAAGVAFLLHMVLFSSCKRDERVGDYRFLVVHAFSEVDDYGNRAKNAYENALKSHDNQAEIYHLFLGLPHSYSSLCQDILKDSLRALAARDWVPDVVILHGDEAVRHYFDFAGKQPVVPQTPCVYVSTLMPDQWKRHPMYSRIPITGYKDSLFVHENLQFFREVWGKRMDVVFKIDRGCGNQFDEYLYDHLKKNIAGDPRYLDNLTCYMTFVERTRILTEEENPPLIMTGVSLRNPLANGNPSGSFEKDWYWGRRVLHNVLQNAKNMRYLQAHVDIFSDIFVDRSEIPQLSMTDMQFMDAYPKRVLGGYFADIQTKANDAMDYALCVAKGTDARSLTPQCHTPEYYLDWDAMNIAGLSYDDWVGRAIIKGAPFSVVHPAGFLVCILMLAFCSILAVVYISRQIMISHHRQNDHIERRRQIHLEWLLGGKNVGLWSLHDRGRLISATNSITMLLGLEENEIYTTAFVRMLHPDDRKDFYQMLRLKETEGTHSHRLRVMNNVTRVYHWFQITYMVSETAIKSSDTMGLIEMVDDDQMAQELLMQSMQEAEQTRLKEAFLANMTHEIRSPLATLVNFTDVLLTDYDTMDRSEKLMVAEQIENSTKSLLKLLNDVVDVSQMQLGEYRFMQEYCSVEEGVVRVYKANSVLVPSHLNYVLERGEVDVKIYADKERMVQV
ncbi:MAG: hypothetical protein HUK03_07595, partial [Bacteroidaceae bacterium]|nr:hypothetical protein [Bacteroidaceae bacterium]